ncbi:Cu(I)-responsive transcriptional regulator [Acidovorax sp. Root275]|uniref:Cu(I)-responsive transcriptional regulator n=1 Tax=Acidovorax sp. Root275 TaxID=1736508 RepID=UPI000AE8680D|nr:Cu(I)-responsive transcriptional regulator [Acidovorax sp. Root275]
MTTPHSTRTTAGQAANGSNGSKGSTGITDTKAATKPRATSWPVPIGVAAQRAGISARMVRHYESLGLVKGVARTDSGYRQYTEADVHALHFIRRSRDLGFSMEEIAELLGLWHDRGRASSQVKRIAQAHIEDLSERIASMQAMQRSLQTLVSCCKGNDRPDCPILDDLAAGQVEHSGARAPHKTLLKQ